MKYIHVCVACGKDCKLRAGKTSKSDPVSSCCRARVDSFTVGKTGGTP